MDWKYSPWLKHVLVLFLCLCLKADRCLGADRITAKQPLSGGETIVSEAGNFTLGFFKPGNSSKYYIGTWYSRVSTQTVVWVANREVPVSDTGASVLRISGGNLILFNGSDYPVWSTGLNTSSNSSSVEAVLGDNGNLVLTDGSKSNSSEPLWQSFDHPADTWLPGGKLAFNKKTNESTLLTSWKSQSDPAPGLFSMKLDPDGTNQYILYCNSTTFYWSSGTWDNQSKIFTNVPEMRLNYIYNFEFVDNENERYFTYGLYNDTLISRFTMDMGGQVKQTNWLDEKKQWLLFWSQPRQTCDVYAICGPFGTCNANSLPFCECSRGFDPKEPSDWDTEAFSGGCKRRTSLRCQTGLAKGKNDRFLTNENMKLPANNQTVAAGGQQECESTCLSNCSCTAYAYDNGQCLIWYGDILDLQQLSVGVSNPQTLYLRLAASELPSAKSNKGVIIGAAAGAAVVLVLVGLLLFVMLRRRRAIRPGKAVEGSLMAFGYRDLQNATKNFSDKLGGGGFGSVFKGALPDSSIIAVKKLESINQGEKQFRTEVSTIGTVQHVNLVRLRGFCSEGAHKLLVYEYMPNGSLDAHLFQAKDSKILDWKTRYEIALGTARGLHYLHEKCRDCIIHCDIKPENILLDAEFGPKVADFGLAKLVGRDFSRVLTTMRGTRGYLAPEWISGVAITAKADVFSYGMMLFEIVSGRRNSDPSADGRMKFFPKWAATTITEGGDCSSLLDPNLEGNGDVEEAIRLCKVACWCIQDDETQRPSMGQVVQILEGVINVTVPPLPRSIQVFADDQEQVIFFTESSSGQSATTESLSAPTSQTRSDNSAVSSLVKSSSSS